MPVLFQPMHQLQTVEIVCQSEKCDQALLLLDADDMQIISLGDFFFAFTSVSRQQHRHLHHILPPVLELYQEHYQAYLMYPAPHLED